VEEEDDVEVVSVALRLVVLVLLTSFLSLEVPRLPLPLSPAFARTSEVVTSRRDWMTLSMARKTRRKYVYSIAYPSSGLRVYIEKSDMLYTILYISISKVPRS
jgi:hypothetical protein